MELMESVVSVTRLAERENRPARDPTRELWLRRQAVQLAGQLPEKPEEALTVLVLMQRLVTEFLTLTPS
jgi:hypothetical protein